MSTDAGGGMLRGRSDATPPGGRQAETLIELEQLLNDPAVTLDAHRVWDLLAGMAGCAGLGSVAGGAEVERSGPAR